MIALLLIIATSVNAFVPYRKRADVIMEEKSTDDEKELLTKFIGNKGVVDFKNNRYEYSVLSYFSGYEKQYIATIKRGDSVANGKGRSSRSALLLALKNLN
ncbi:hypothetical protein EDI_065590 [Entamoeba dispar SAW760]|uniref:Uncharacterized protein n=1 Tax=Entamoeba dispar (strain ATCC PRA-260 / SAW760) TaxID=370354 RepID=B0EJR3_ENTDS|nr:uncharacterized protein EDI_065590 [Entamoeba dispar SAW760]EDR25233.1 hypothetical protein EDI_065590 [Entamoeba dispar SAW760]|eukprot:EDR25233.1 hypothetical protein EDI_065590 [Entamoeba dispar SAW760]